jgi:transaldolase
MINSTRLTALHETCGQSPWLDTLSRAYLLDGTLERWLQQGIRGVTSNPSIFQKAIAGSSLYDHELLQSYTHHRDVHVAYWDLVCSDIANAADMFRGLYESSAGQDGYVSVEVSPDLAYDTVATVAAARTLWERLNRPNVMIKVPATQAGIDAVRQIVANGINVNVTLIFSLDTYAQVLESYLGGLEELATTNPTAVSTVASVASFFVSRVDTEIDQRLADIGSHEALAMRGRSAIAQARLAYAHFQESMLSTRWADLQSRHGATPQRPLWASTSTKNPQYPDTLYVDQLIGPLSVNTLPEPTARAFDDHGVVRQTIDVGLEEARKEWDSLQRLGVDTQDVARLLEKQGVDAFRKSFDDLLSELRDKVAQLT